MFNDDLESTFADPFSGIVSPSVVYEHARKEMKEEEEKMSPRVSDLISPTIKKRDVKT